jgi:hypothetical protein
VKHASGYTGRIYYYNKLVETEEPQEEVTKSTCMGKTLTVNMRSYATDTAFIDTLWVGADTLTIMPVSLTFTQPEMEYDTVYLSMSEMNVGYRYASGDIFHEIGDYVVEIRKTNTCTRRIQLTILEKPIPQGMEQDDMPRKATKRMRDGQLVLIINGKEYNVLGQQLYLYKQINEFSN